MNQITKNFSYEEMTVTNSGLPNNPNAEQLHYLTLLCEKVLQPLRDKYGKHIHVNSGYRSFEVNKYANKGKIRPSQHCEGKAADLNAGSKEENKILFDMLSKMDKDQLINEDDFTWVHVSFNPNGNRNQKLKKVGEQYIPVA